MSWESVFLRSGAKFYLSCQGGYACEYVENSIIGKGSCNGASNEYIYQSSCYKSKNITIGNNSCNKDPNSLVGVCAECAHNVPDKACNQGITDDMTDGYCNYCGENPFQGVLFSSTSKNKKS